MVNGTKYENLTLEEVRERVDKITDKFYSVKDNYSGIRGFFSLRMMEDDKTIVGHCLSRVYALNSAKSLEKEIESKGYDNSLSQELGKLHSEIFSFSTSFEFTGIRGIFKKISSIK